MQTNGTRSVGAVPHACGLTTAPIPLYRRIDRIGKLRRPSAVFLDGTQRDRLTRTEHNKHNNREPMRAVLRLGRQRDCCQEAIFDGMAFVSADTSDIFRFAHPNELPCCVSHSFSACSPPRPAAQRWVGCSSQSRTARPADPSTIAHGNNRISTISAAALRSRTSIDAPPDCLADSPSASESARGLARRVAGCVRGD